MKELIGYDEETGLAIWEVEDEEHIVVGIGCPDLNVVHINGEILDNNLSNLKVVARQKPKN